MLAETWQGWLSFLPSKKRALILRKNMKKYFATERDNILGWSLIYGFVWETEKGIVPNKMRHTRKYSSVNPSTLYRPGLVCINLHLSWMSMWLIKALILEGGDLSLIHLPPACVWPSSRLGNWCVPLHAINRGGWAAPLHTKAAAVPADQQDQRVSCSLKAPGSIQQHLDTDLMWNGKVCGTGEQGQWI